MKSLLFLMLIGMQTFCFGQSAAEKYVMQYHDLAIKLMNRNEIPASVILGIAIHESASGNSKIAHYLNNHFGVKGTNNNAQIKSAYKGYDSSEDSYIDFISMMKSRPKFKILFDKFSDFDYKNWIYGIQKGGYAASRTWAAQVISIINRYKLYELDNRPKEQQEPVLEIVKDINVASVIIYKIKKGDTLNAIAKKFNTSAKSIMKKNNLKTSILQIGEKLKIE